MTKSRDVMDAYVGAWNTDDPAERRRLVQRALTEDAVVAYPNLSAEGQEEIAAAIGGLHEQIPGVHFVPTSGIEEHHGWLRATWRMLEGDGSIRSDGEDVAEISGDGRFSRVIGFHNPAPPQ